MSKITTLLRDTRKRKKITQAALAEKLGYNQSHIAHFESEKRQILSGNIEKICDALEVDIVLVDRPTRK